ncbi:MAG: hypothetical protein GY835_16035 [bacterium]|nr:hypothetical protein [bacterium]
MTRRRLNRVTADTGALTTLHDRFGDSDYRFIYVMTGDSDMLRTTRPQRLPSCRPNP